MAPGTLVLVFGMPGCPACAEHVPRVRAVAARYPDVPALLVDAAARPDLADVRGITATPTTILYRGHVEVYRVVGALGEGEILRVFEAARRG